MSGSKIRLYGSTSGYVELAAPAVADDAVLTLPTAAAGFGKVRQVVSTIKTDTFSEAVAGTAVTGDITGLTATLTPDATSTLVITAQVNFALTTTIGGLILYRDGSPVAVGDADGSRRQSTTTRQDGMTTSETSVTTIHATVPASAAAATTFSIRIANASGGSGTVYVNRSATDANALNDFRGSSTITVMEVAA